MWVVYEHRNNNMYHIQEILENHKKIDLASRDKVDFSGVHAGPQQIFAAHCKSSCNLEGDNTETELNMYQIRNRC